MEETYQISLKKASPYAETSDTFQTEQPFKINKCDDKRQTKHKPLNRAELNLQLVQTSYWTRNQVDR